MQLIPNKYLLSFLFLWFLFLSKNLFQCIRDVSYKTRTINPLEPPDEYSPHIKIAVLLPNQNKSQCDLMKVLPAIDVAIDTVRETYSLFKNAKFTITYSDSESNVTIAPLRAIDIFNDNLATVMLGPVNSFPLANVVRYSSYRYKVPIISAQGFASDLGDKSHFPLLTRISGTYKDMASVFEQIFTTFEWTPKNHNTFVVWYIWDKVNDYECNFQTKPIMDSFKQKGYKYIEISDELQVMGLETLENRTINNLQRISKNARITIICANSSYVRSIMLAAHKMKLTNGEYVYFNIDLSASQINGNKQWNVSTDTKENNELAREAYRSLITVSFTQPDDQGYTEFAEKVKNKSKTFYGYNYVGDANSCVGLFHDAVLVYCIALKEALKKNYTITDGEVVTKMIWNRTILGISGEVFIDSNGDGFANYSLFDMNVSSGVFQEVATFCGKDVSFKMKKGVQIDWVNKLNKPPTDTPKCGFDDSGCPHISPWLAAVITIMAITVVFGIGIFFYHRQRMKTELESMDWKISWADIETQEKRFRRRSLNSTNKKSSYHPLIVESRLNDNRNNYLNPKYQSNIFKDGPNEFSPLFSQSHSYRKSISEMSHRSDSSSSVLTLAGIQLSQLASTQMFAKTAIYKGNIVALKHLNLDGRRIEINRDVLFQVKTIRDLNNNHIARFIGICLDTGNECILTEYCPKGSLQDVLENEQIKLDSMFRLSLMQDMCRGMMYLQSTAVYHGNLKSSNCLVDSRFVLKITDFGLQSFRVGKEISNHDSFQFYKNKLWTAPEYLRNPSLNGVGIAKADVYSFAIVCQEIIYRSGVFYISDVDIISPDFVVERVKKGEIPPFRPRLNSEKGISEDIISIVKSCWNEDPNLRPSFAQIKLKLRRINGAGDGDILDNLLSRMEQYANNLEGLVAQRTQQYYEEKRKAEDLLYSMLPKSVAGQLIRGEPVTAESFEKVTIYFSDICGFTALSAESTPMEVITLLNNLYTLFDSITEDHDVYKVETIGDAYMVVSGLPQRNGIMHVRHIACMSIAFLSEIYKFKIPHKPDQQLKIRIGMHTGMVCAGVVGVKMPRYCLFGDTVNTASRMESNGMPLKIHVSESSKRELDTFGEFVLTERGNVDIKGKGIQKTYWLHGTKDNIVDPLPLQ